MEKAKRFYIISCHVLWREICHFTATSRNVYDFHFLKQGLHDTPEILRDQLQAAIDAVDGDYDAILLGYGLCGNALEGITARDRRLVIMRGHDCITFLLGSKEQYQEHFENSPGTYWYSPGWIDGGSMPGKERYEEKLKAYVEKYGEDNGKYLMEMEQGWFTQYNRAVYVDLGVGEVDGYRDYTKACADWLGWNHEEVEGDPGLMKRFIQGHWDSEDFLVVEPGETVVPTHDAAIMAAKPADSQ